MIRTGRDQKMNDLEEEEDGAESVVSGCQSTKSDRSRRKPPDFSKESGPSDTKIQSLPAVNTGSADSASPHTRTRLLHQETGSFPSVVKDPEKVRLSICRLMSSLYVVKHEHKTRVKGTYERVTEGADQTGSGTLLSRIYTVVYITDN
ncbi:hypothetical protein FQN60_002557 [Etheostoma spectabile]|uniref:FISNA domain-containing protein n=1 Tax=Etheostoma spectabile TaxID=54343 RepID=A0A5J5C7M0_9PERO|nr:hypothetical protein FQN60_002557 [Etheostoma spectabile]